MSTFPDLTLDDASRFRGMNRVEVIQLLLSIERRQIETIAAVRAENIQMEELKAEHARILTEKQLQVDALADRVTELRQQNSDLKSRCKCR